MPQAPQHVDRQTFLGYLRQSGLVNDQQLAAVAERLPDSPRGRVLARTLVELGLLTKFQAERVLAGRTGGFLLGQYRILDQLGRGGMGRVFKAVHQTMNRVVALKVLVPEFLEADKAKQLFLREMQAAARLSHPNIVTAYDANQVGERYYLVMEYVDGPNLDRLIRDNGPLPVAQACDFVRQTALGLQHAHDLGMVHRDIKPANLLLAGTARSGQKLIVKILDFGLARFGRRDGDGADDMSTIITKADAVMGTPDYVSPEQTRSVHDVDIRSDLYSLGCTFYYFLTGQVPFPGDSALEKIIRHTTDLAEPVEALRPEVPPEVAAVVARLMAKSPAERFQTPAELAEALEPFALGATALPGPHFQAPRALDTDPDFDPDVTRSEERALLVKPVTSDSTPTKPTLPPQFGLTNLRDEVSAQERQRVLLALGVAAGVVFGMLGMVGLFVLFFYGL